jgi:hypothetical protein
VRQWPSPAGERRPGFAAISAVIAATGAIPGRKTVFWRQARNLKWNFPPALQVRPPPDEPAPAESAEAPTPAIAIPETTSPSAGPNVWLTALAPSADSSGRVWLARAGRFVNEMVQPSGRRRWTERRLKCPAGESARTGSAVWLLTELS